MQIELNIEQTILTALSEALNPENLTEKIKAQVEIAADRAIVQAINGYGSDFSKTLSAAVQKMLPHELNLDGQAKWNNAISQYISASLANMNNQRIEQALKPMLDKMLATMPAEMKLSELVDKAIEMWGDDYAIKEDSIDRPTIIVRDSEGVISGFSQIYMDKEGGKSQYNCGIQISVTDKGEVYRIHLDNKEINGHRFAGPFFGFEAFLFQLYTGGTKLVIDERDFSDVRYPDHNND